MGQSAITHKNNGTREIPGQDVSWDSWVTATDTRNYCAQDTLLDWLNEFGEPKGYIPDNKLPEYDPRTDFLQFLLRKGREFESAVIHCLNEQTSLVQIKSDSARDLVSAQATWEAMTKGAETIAQAVLWNPENQTFGAADLLIRSDILNKLFPGSLPATDVSRSAPDLPGSKWHYRIIEIKYTTLELLVDGHISSSELSYMVQAWLYNEALGRLQGYLPETACLLGRSWKQRNERGLSCMERLASIKCTGTLKKKGDIGDYANKACSWIREMRTRGSQWEVLPLPSVRELYPNMRNAKEDQPWHSAKREIAIELNELTLLPRVNPQGRNAALDKGIKSWKDVRCNAESLNVTGASYVTTLERVIAANHDPTQEQKVFPDRITANQNLWREQVLLEFFVDFETVNDLNDDFSQFPLKGGLASIFMIGCGFLEKRNDQTSWKFRVFCANALSESEEIRIIGEWVQFMKDVAKDKGISLDGNSRLFHWSAAELSMLENSYNSARARHGKVWPDLSWVDLLGRVIKEEPVTVHGAFGFSLKEMAKPMKQYGLIRTSWMEGPVDGLGATVGAWHCNIETQKTGINMVDQPLMQDIVKYNEVDCKVMMEILEYIRANK